MGCGEARCAICGKKYTKASKAQRYCCKRCKDVAYNRNKRKPQPTPDDGLTPLQRKMRRSTVTVDSYIPVRHVRDSM